MKKRLTSVLLCMLLITLQILSAGSAVLAQGEIEVTTGVTGMVTSINGMPFVSAMGAYSINYNIKNNSQTEIHVIEILEKASGSNETKSVKINTRLQPGESLPTRQGNTFYGGPDVNPNVVEYQVKYTVQKEEGEQEQLMTGQPVYVHVIEAEFNVTYTSQAQSPVFKGEQVKLQAVVQAISNVTLYNLTVFDNDLGEEIGFIDVLAPGAAATVEKTLPIERSTTGNLVIIYDDPLGLGNPVQKNVKTSLELQVRDEEPVSSVELSGKADKSKIPGATNVAFELLVKNTGNTILRELKCLDWNGKEFFTYDALQPGEEVKAAFTGEVKPDTEYELQVQARVENSNQLIKSTWSAVLEKLNPQVEIHRTVSVDRIQAGQPFVLNYVVRNIGNVDLKDIIVTETSFGEITRLDHLPAGGEAEFTKELVLDKNEYSKTILTARDAETDKEYSYESSEMEFAIGGSVEDTPGQALSILLQSDKESLTKPGKVELECIVVNTGQEPLYNLVLTLLDRDMTIGSLSVLEPGEDKTFTIPAVLVEETETFVVEANGLGGDQQKFTAKSQPLTIEVAESGLSGKFSILRVILIVVILICVLIIGVLVYTLRGSLRFPFRRKKNKTTRSS